MRGDPTTEDTTHFSHRTQRNKVGTELEDSTLAGYILQYYKVLEDCCRMNAISSLIVMGAPAGAGIKNLVRCAH